MSETKPAVVVVENKHMFEALTLKIGGEHMKLNIHDVDLRDATVARSQVFHGCDFDRSYLGGANFRSSKFHNCSMHSVRAQKCNFDFAYFNSVDLSGADLTFANFEGVTFANVDFMHANFFGATLNGAVLGACKFYGAKGIRAITGVGSSNREVYGVAHPDGKLMVQAGCFWGDAKAVREAIKEKYGYKQVKKELFEDYMACIKLLVSWRKMLPKDGVESGIPF